jgi:hypothetical protein
MTSLINWLPPEEKYCVFCGAGFSKWAVGLPTAYELFDFQIKSYGPRETLKLKQIQEIKIQWDNNNPSGNAEAFIAYLIDYSIGYKKLVNWYIARRLAEPFIERMSYFETHYHGSARGRRALGINDRRKAKVIGIKKAELFLNDLPRQNFEGILTTNYDLVIEYALGTKKFFYGNRPRLLHGPPRAYTTSAKERYPIYLTGTLPVIKLHGSISLTDRGYCADGRGCITGKAIIIPPTRNKKISDILIQEWEYARRILKNSKKIIFFGFRFNDYDQELIELFKETTPWIQKIILINTNPEGKFLAEKIWPSAEIVVIHPKELSEKDLHSIL